MTSPVRLQSLKNWIRAGYTDRDGKYSRNFGPEEPDLRKSRWEICPFFEAGRPPVNHPLPSSKHSPKALGANTQTAAREWHWASRRSFRTGLLLEPADHQHCILSCLVDEKTHAQQCHCLGPIRRQISRNLRCACNPFPIFPDYPPTRNGGTESWLRNGKGMEAGVDTAVRWTST